MIQLNRLTEEDFVKKLKVSLFSFEFFGIYGGSIVFFWNNQAIIESVAHSKTYLGSLKHYLVWPFYQTAAFPRAYLAFAKHLTF